ncbi:MAG: sodium-translocating pyrophosphatase [Planctomycetia bacterium]|nr:sodium-translocating pyrophosphatase [Planctomycetia bacterium]
MLGELPLLWWLAPAGSVLALVYAYKFYREIRAADPGDARMQEIAGYVREGAFAYLKRQYVVVGVVFLVLVILLTWQAFGLKQQHPLVPFAFLTGGFFSGLAGFFGMNTATRASNRTTQGAKESLNRGLQIAFRAGSVMGLVVVGLGLLDITLWFLVLAGVMPLLGYQMSVEQITVVMLCFGMGASTQALFARVGGGIFTKSADVGADLVGKTEAGIPEDDPRNPATIADNVGDNVGDVAGMGADLYESYCGSILATAALGAAAAAALRLSDEQLRAQGMSALEVSLRFVSAPMILAGIGIALSILSIYFVKTEEGATQRNLLWALRRGVWGASGLIVVAALLVTWLILGGIQTAAGAPIWLGMFGSIVTGLLAGVLIGWFTEYYTAAEYSPTIWLASQCSTGPATTIIGGVAQGMLSCWASLSIVGIATILAYGFAGGFTLPALGLYGVGIAAVGMLATLGITLATDAYGPIADNAGGNAQMTHQPPEVRERTDALDSLGNTTAATGKGFAIGSAALTALALLAAFVEEIRVGIQREATNFVVDQGNLTVGQIVPLGHGKYAEKSAQPEAESGFYPAYIRVSGGEGSAPFVQTSDGVRRATDQEITDHYKPEIKAQYPVFNLKPVHAASLADFMEFYNVNLMNPRVLVGAFMGVLMVFVFCGLTMKAVGRAAGRMVEEVRRQFRELNLLSDENAKADYATCVSIATAGAQREMILPALLAVAAPLAVGLLLDVGGLMGMLVGALTSGFAVAIFMANAGGAWDNAKKYIESGQLGGKGSDAHKAGVVGDTVGDPFKDTSGPALNILIKLMSMVAVVFAGLIVAYSPVIARALGMGD